MTELAGLRTGLMTLLSCLMNGLVWMIWPGWHTRLVSGLTGLMTCLRISLIFLNELMICLTGLMTDLMIGMMTGLMIDLMS
jgi:hypothetical protein